MAGATYGFFMEIIMKNKIYILLVSVLTIFVLLIFFIYTGQKDKPAIIESEKIAKNIEKKDTIKFSGNVVKLGFQKEGVSNNKKKSIKKQQSTNKNNEVVNNFLKNYANKKLTFQEKIKVLETMLIHEPSFWGNHNELYNLIVNEKDKRLVGELIDEFFLLYARPYNEKLPSPTHEQREEIFNMVKELIKNPLTSIRAISSANMLLNDQEIQYIYNELNGQLGDKEKSGLANSYANNRILNGKDPYAGEFNEIEKYLPKEEVKKRTQNLLGFMSKFTEGKDTSSWDNEFIRKQLESPIANAQPDRYIEWMRARASMLQGYQAKAQFINSEFHKISQPYKHEFILRMPTYTPMVENLYAFLLNREQQLLQILTNVIRIDDPKVFKALAEFRAMFLFSNNDNLKQRIDRIVKQLIDILPDYQVSLDILKFIKDEQVYIPSNGFNIDSHIQRISSSITTKKKESDLDTGRIPDDNPL